MKEKREVAIMLVFADGGGGERGGRELIPTTAKKRSLLYFLHAVAGSRYLPISHSRGFNYPMVTIFSDKINSPLVNSSWLLTALS
jgi:hypothetical protein